MKNTTMMRIIYKPEDTPIKEYLKTFFSYIGLIVYDEKIYKNEKFVEHLNIRNESVGVDIVINYYVSEESKRFSKTPELQNRIYLYYDTESQICEIKKEPYYYREEKLDKKNNISKKEQRIKSLDLLVNEIWKNDEENRLAIQQIKNCYVPENEDNDLFFMLQELKIIEETYNNKYFNMLLVDYKEESYIDPELYSDDISYEERERRKARQAEANAAIAERNANRKEYFNKEIIIDEYIIDIIDELIKISCLFKDDSNENPYIEYVRINNLRLLSLLHKHLSKEYSEKLYSKCEMKGLKFKFDEDLKEEHKKFSRKYPWFVGMYFLDWKLWDNPNTYKILSLLMVKSSFPAYYLPVWERMMYVAIENKDVDKLIKIYQKIVKLPNLPYVLMMIISFNIGLLRLESGMLDHFSNINSFIFDDKLKYYDRELYGYFNTKEELSNFEYEKFGKYLKVFSLEDILLYSFSCHYDAIISIKTREEVKRLYLKRLLFKLLILFEESFFMRDIVNDGEKGYKEFKTYNNMSTMCYYLYYLFSTDDYQVPFIRIDRDLFEKYYKIRKRELIQHQNYNFLEDDDIFFLDKEKREKIKEKKLNL